jgi:sulfur carrier protein
MFNIFINSQPFQVQTSTCLQEAIRLSGFSDQVVAVAINGEFVPKSLYSQTTLNDQDNIDIVKPIGGG